MIELSFTVHTFEDLKSDSMKEILLNIGWNFVKVTKIGNSTFLFTFEERELISMVNWEDTRMWIEQFDKTRMEDLVVPRVAWLKVFGLPFIATTNHVMEGLIGSKGSLQGISSNLVDLNQFLALWISISTKLGEILDFSKKISLDNKVYDVWLKEEVRETGLTISHHEKSRNNRVESWMRSSILQDEASSSKDLENRTEIPDQAILVGNLNLDDDYNVNPDLQVPLFCNNREENWGANS